MADSRPPTVQELEERYQFPNDYLDQECSRTHIEEISVVLQSWTTVAHHIGLEPEQINEIAKNSKNEEEKPLVCLITWKQEQSSEATYRKLLKALVKIGLCEVARRICEIIKSPVSQNPLVTVESITSSFRTLALEKGLEDELNEFERKFNSLVRSTKKLFENQSLDDFKYAACMLPSYMKAPFGQLFCNQVSEIYKAKEIGEIFVYLSYFWDFLNPDLLEYIVDDMKIIEAQKPIEDYKKDLNEFRKRVKLGDYLQFRSCNLESRDFKEIVSVLGGDCYNQTLADVETMRINFSHRFSLLKYLPKMNGLRLCSIAVVFCLPVDINISNADLHSFFSEQKGVEKVMVDGVCIYELKADMETVQKTSGNDRTIVTLESTDYYQLQSSDHQTQDSLVEYDSAVESTFRDSESSTFSEDYYYIDQTLESRNFDVDISRPNDGDSRVCELCAAAQDRDLKKVKTLVETDCCDPLVENNYGVNALHCAAIGGSLEVFKYLVGEKKCNPSCVNQVGHTPLHLASFHARLNIIEYLIKDGRVDAMAQDVDKITALHYACMGGSLNIVKILLKEVAKQKPINEILYEPTKYGFTVLHYASYCGHLDVVKYFLSEECNMDPNLRSTYYGATPLHYAAGRGHLHVAKYLVNERKCNLKITDRHGGSALHHAVICNRLDVVKFFVENSHFSPYIKNRYNMTPFQIAVNKQHKEILNYFLTCY